MMKIKRLSILLFFIFVALSIPALAQNQDTDDYLVKKEPPCYAKDRLKPNVLIVLGTTGSMLWSSYVPGGSVYNPKDIVDCPNDYEGCTFGDGSNTFTQTYGYQVRNNNYHGRDIYSPNNYDNPASPDNKDIYYYNTDILGYPPNDSRLYQAKNALWKLLNDEGLTDEIKFGLMTYYQDFVPKRYPYAGNGFYVLADFYHYQVDTCTDGGCLPYMDGFLCCCGSPYQNSCGVMWGVDINDWDRRGKWRNIRGGRLVVPVSEDSIDKIKIWIDGVESPYNHSALRYEGTNYELRADGPGVIGDTLSEKLAAGWNHGGVSVRKYFESGIRQKEYHYLSGNQVRRGVWKYYPSPVESYCQKNYVILIVDGLDYYYKDNPDKLVEAVRDLMNIHYQGNPLNPIIPMKVYVVGFTFPDLDPNHILNKMAQAGGTNKAYTAKKPAQLQQVLRDILKEIHNDAASTSPVIIPPSRRNDQSEYLYISTFTPYDFHTWKGHLYCYSLDVFSEDSYTINDYLWDAGSKLDDILPEERKLYTWCWYSNFTQPARLISFSESNKDLIHNMILFPPTPISQNEPADQETVNIINYILGKDAFDEEKGDYRWKLADIYHSWIIEIGKPTGTLADSKYIEFKNQWSQREPIVYAPTNDGVLHAFDAKTGEELWGFIPPTSIRWLKSIHTEGVIGQTRPLYLLDGPINAEDARINDSWYTVLVGTGGKSSFINQGGVLKGETNSLYALILPNTKESLPTFLWAIGSDYLGEYKPQVDNSSTVYVWNNPDITGGLSFLSFLYKDLPGGISLTLPYIHPYDYRWISNLLCPPVIGYVYTKDSQHPLPKKRFVVTLVSEKYNYKETTQTGINYYTTTAFYVIDLQTAKVIHLDLKKHILNDSQLSIDIDKLLQRSAQMVALKPSNPLEGQRFTLIYTTDIYGYIYKHNLKAVADLTDWGTTNWNGVESWTTTPIFFLSSDGQKPIGHASNYLEVAELDNDIWLFVSLGDTYLCSTDQTGRFVAINTSKLPQPFNPATNNLNLLSTLVASEDTPSLYGWTIDLQENERVISPPVVYANTVFFTTFIPDLQDPCKIGRSYLYGINIKSGSGIFGQLTNTGNPQELTGRAISLGEVIATGISIRKNRIYISVSPAAENNSQLPQGWKQKGNIISAQLPVSVTSNIPSPVQYIKPVYWKEKVGD